MIAIFNIEGRQLKVEENQEFYVNKVTGKKGDKLSFDNVLLIEDKGRITVGKPTISGAQVNASIIEQKKGDKVVVFKKKRRKGYKIKNGHRQLLTKIKIDSISIGSKKMTKTKEDSLKKDNSATAKKTTAKKTTKK